MAYAVIMAGGGGTRFWPTSRRAYPKQFLTLSGSRSFLQATFARLQPMFPAERVLVVTNARWRREVRRQLPRLPTRNIIAEPAMRNTAPCIGFAMLHLRRRDPGASFVVLPSDHLISEAARFRRYLRDGLRFLDRHPEYSVTLGIRPTSPSTAYGYVQRGRVLDRTPSGAVETVRRFIEKPQAARARRFVQSGSYLWNAGIFLWKLETFEQLLGRHMPRLARQLKRIDALIGRRGKAAEIARLYERLPSLSVDYGVMEKARRVAVLPCDVPWSDVGSWSALTDLLPRDAKHNVMRHPARTTLLDVSGSIIYTDDLHVAALGVRDLIIVQHGEALLICPRERDQELRALLAKLDREGKTSLL